MKLAAVYLFIGVLVFLISGFVSGTWNFAAMDMDVKIGTIMAGCFAGVFATIFKDEL